MRGSELLERIPAQDWEATPSSVRTLLLSLLPLAAEASELRARLRAMEPQSELDLSPEDAEHRGRLERYHTLVDRLFLGGLSTEEQSEMERLGAEIDAQNAPFYASALHRMEAALRPATRCLCSD